MSTDNVIQMIGGDARKLKELLSDPVVKDKLKSHNKHPLMLQLVKNKAPTECLEVAFEEGFGVNDTSDGGLSALHSAVGLNLWEHVEWLVKHGANVFSLWKYDEEHYYTPFALAIASGHSKDTKNFKASLRKLLSTDVNQADNNALLQCPRPPFDLDGFTMLMYACLSQNEEAVQWLVEAGADVNKPAKCGCLPIQVAMLTGKVEIVEYLLPKSDMSLCKWNDKKKELLVGQMICSERIMLQERILQSGVDPNIFIHRNGALVTPLLVACANDAELSFINSLLQHGADPNWVDPHTNRTALWAAMPRKEQPVVKVLLDYGADMFLTELSVKKLRDSGGHMLTTMGHALRWRNIDAIELLVEAGCDVTCVEDQVDRIKQQLKPATYERIYEANHNPKQLVKLARSVIRHSIGCNNVRTKIDSLNVPVGIKVFLCAHAFQQS